MSNKNCAAPLQGKDRSAVSKVKAYKPSERLVSLDAMTPRHLALAAICLGRGCQAVKRPVFPGRSNYNKVPQKHWWNRRVLLFPQFVGLGALALGVRRLTSSSRSALWPAKMAVIDSHLHIWSESGSPLVRPAPPGLEDESVTSAEGLLRVMDTCGVSSALIVQPINYEFDHGYVADAIRRYPDKFRGMLLADPSTPPSEMRVKLESLRSRGFSGVRLNPYLWTTQEGDWIEDDFGTALFEACAALDNMPIGIMAFGGLMPLANHIESLAAKYPSLPVVLDHWAFPRGNPAASPSPDLKFDSGAWARLLEMAKLPNLYVKISALFRVSSQPAPYADLEPRFRELLQTYGPNRLMWGSDFPYVVLQPGGYAAQLDAVKTWTLNALPDRTDHVDSIMSGNAKRLFGFGEKI